MNWEALLHALLTNRSTLLDVTASLLILILVLIGLPTYLIRKRPRTSAETVKLLCSLKQHPSFRIQILGGCMANIWYTTKNHKGPDKLRLEFLSNTYVVFHSTRPIPICCGGKGHILTLQAPTSPTSPTPDSPNSSDTTNEYEELVGSFYNPKGFPIIIQAHRSKWQHARHACTAFVERFFSHQ